MNYNDLKQSILRKIDTWKDKVKEMVEEASKYEDWENIRDEITFIIEGYGSIWMIDHLQEAEKKFDEEESAKSEDQGLSSESE